MPGKVPVVSSHKIFIGKLSPDLVGESKNMNFDLSLVMHSTNEICRWPNDIHASYIS